MQEPWEVFYRVWRETVGTLVGPPGRGRTQRLAAATAAAAAATERHLRGSLDWSLVGSRIAVVRMTATAEEWAMYGTDPGQLRFWLHAAWVSEWRLCEREAERRTVTVAVLGGADAGDAGADVEPADPFELRSW